MGKAAGVRFEPLTEYDPADFFPGRPYEARRASFNEMARKCNGYDRTGPVPLLKRGVKTEVDYTVGHVIREGGRVGLPTPICQTLVRMIHEIEEGKRALEAHNYAELAGAAA